jgi:hypothetical protein
MERIHIVGVGPRTGTTLMTECMAACFDIDAFDAHEARVTNHRWNAEVYLSKWPAEIFTVSPRLRLDEHFHVICMIRDPRDVVVSRHAIDQERYWTPLHFWKKQIGHVRRLVGRRRFILVKYEDLVTRPDSVQDEIMRRLTFLRKKRNFGRFHEVATPSARATEALGGVRPITPRRIGNWRNHLPRVAGQIAVHGSIIEDLIEFGYEADDSWLSILKDVNPDYKPSHWTEESEAAASHHASMAFRAWADAILIVALRLFGWRIV